MGKPDNLPEAAGAPSEYAPAFFPPLELPTTANTGGAEYAATDGIDMAADYVPEFFDIG